MEIFKDFQEFFLSLGDKEDDMGKRLTPEEREARLKAYEEAKAARQAIRLEKKKARIEAWEKAKASREKRREFEKRGAKAAEEHVSTKVSTVNAFPSYPGEVEVGDTLGFRFLGMAMSGTLVKVTKDRNYRVREVEGVEELEEVAGREAFIISYTIKDSEGTFYPIRKNDILAKKVNGVWIDKFNYSKQ